MYPSPSPMPLRPINGLAIATLVMLAVDSLVGLVAVIIDLRYADLITRLIDNPDSVTDQEVEAGDSLYGLSGILETATFVITGVLFVVWLFRARSNAELLTPYPHRRAKAWLVFGWVVPVIAWWFPKQIVDDIWSSSKQGGLYPTNDFRTATRSLLVGAWWLMWLATTWLSSALSRVLLSAEDLEQIRSAARFDLAVNLLEVVCAVLAALVVLKISRFQEEHRRAPAPDSLSTKD